MSRTSVQTALNVDCFMTVCNAITRHDAVSLFCIAVHILQCLYFVPLFTFSSVFILYRCSHSLVSLFCTAVHILQCILYHCSHSPFLNYLLVSAVVLHSKVVDCKMFKCKAVARAWSQYILLKTSFCNLFQNLKFWKNKRRKRRQCQTLRTFQNLLVTSSEPVRINTAPICTLLHVTLLCISDKNFAFFN